MLKITRLIEFTGLLSKKGRFRVIGVLYCLAMKEIQVNVFTKAGLIIFPYHLYYNFVTW